jgi:hypothetical protein
VPVGATVGDSGPNSAWLMDAATARSAVGTCSPTVRQFPSGTVSTGGNFDGDRQLGDTAGILAVTLIGMNPRVRGLWKILAAAAVAAGSGWALYAVWSSPHRPYLATYAAFAIPLVALVAAGISWVWRIQLTENVAESEARTRLRDAEKQLAVSLQRGPDVGKAIPSTEEAPRKVESDRLALPALWEVTHSRLDLYHQIATSQARRSFVTAQLAIGAGFALLIGFAILAAQTRTTAGAITAGSLGAVSAALAGYISRTFVRSQESAAMHLRAYFDQPLEFSKYLAAERLIADNTDLDANKRVAILTDLVLAIVAPGGSSSANDTGQRTGQPR